jgi:hypothetical protein
MGRVTLNAINAAIRDAGSDFELVRGKGYFYFISPTQMLRDSSVATMHLSGLTVEQWLGELRYKIDETNAKTIDDDYLIPQLMDKTPR